MADWIGYRCCYSTLLSSLLLLLLPAVPLVAASSSRSVSVPLPLASWFHFLPVRATVDRCCVIASFGCGFDFDIVHWSLFHRSITVLSPFAASLRVVHDGHLKKFCSSLAMRRDGAGTSLEYESIDGQLRINIQIKLVGK